ncbi:MAG: single-stranded-DNA-specific exonuclease RecJ, partial [Lachnospiraceae bacterium]
YVEKVRIDVPMPFSYVNDELIRQLSLLEPFGNGNPKPLFAQKNLTLDGTRVFGRNQNVGKYRVTDEYGGRYELTYFGGQEELQRYWKKKEKISVTYYPQLNTYRGKSEIQLVIQNYQ